MRVDYFNNMEKEKKQPRTTFDSYEAKRNELMRKMQTLKQFEQSDELVNKVFLICRQIFERKGDVQNIEWLLQRGTELAAYFGILEGRANEAWGDYKVAEIAFKSVKEALMLGLRGVGKVGTVTEAKAQANQSMGEVEVDCIAREQRAKNYATAAKMCDRMVSFIQTTLRQKEQDMAKVNVARGRNGEKP